MPDIRNCLACCAHKFAAYALTTFVGRHKKGFLETARLLLLLRLGSKKKVGSERIAKRSEHTRFVSKDNAKRVMRALSRFLAPSVPREVETRHGEECKWGTEPAEKTLRAQDSLTRREPGELRKAHGPS